MKSKVNDLDVDYIGDEVPLTAVEEKAISDYIKQRKHQKSKQSLSIIKNKKLPGVKA